MAIMESVYIEAPVERVFDFAADPRTAWTTMPDTMTGHGELVDVTTTKEGVGTYYSWALRFAGLRLEGFDVYTEFIRNQRITDRSSMSFVGTWTVTFEPEGSGTRVTEWRHPIALWPLRPVDRLMDRFRAPLEQQSLAKMKAALEGTAPRMATPAPVGSAG